MQTSKRINNKINRRKYSRPFEVNVCAIQCGISGGNGPYGLSKICSALNLLPPVKHGYKKVTGDLCLFSCDEAEEAMKNAAQNVKTHLINTDSGCSNMSVDDIFNIAVTVDGTWQKRYGFSSLLGVVFVLLLDTGEVIDYQIKSKYCFECKARKHWDKNSERYQIWYDSHQSDCHINHTKPSGSMEVDSVLDIFKRSIESRGRRYTTYVDGDSSSFAVVRDKMIDIYGDDYNVVKEDCVGHIQKWMGSRLRHYKKNDGRSPFT